MNDEQRGVMLTRAAALMPGVCAELASVRARLVAQVSAGAPADVGLRLAEADDALDAVCRGLELLAAFVEQYRHREAA